MPTRQRPVSKNFLFASILFLLLLNFLLWKAKFYQIGQLIEYASQVICPIALYLLIYKKLSFEALVLPIKVAIALTFIGHGLYAIGFHPQPGHFVDMILNVFPIQESSAKQILVIAGILDFLAAIALFIKPIFRIGIWYIIIWAILTSFARIVAHIDIDLFWSSFNQWFFEVLVRVPHFGLPLAIWAHYKGQTAHNLA